MYKVDTRRGNLQRSRPLKRSKQTDKKQPTNTELLLNVASHLRNRTTKVTTECHSWKD